MSQTFSLSFGGQICVKLSVGSEGDQPKAGGAERPPDTCLSGHTQGGFGLAWSAACPGCLASTGTDGMLAVWDLHSSDGRKKAKEVRP